MNNGDIPALAYIEQQILGQADREEGLLRYARNMEQNYGLKSGLLGTGLFWQTRFLSLLYLLILFPKEYWKMEQNDPVYQQIQRQWSLNGIIVLTPDERYGHTIYGFIHRLRNALAHANIVFHGEALEIFDHGNGREYYRARISRNVAENFLEKVGSVMANQRNSIIQ